MEPDPYDKQNLTLGNACRMLLSACECVAFTMVLFGIVMRGDGERG